MRNWINTLPLIQSWFESLLTTRYLRKAEVLFLLLFMEGNCECHNARCDGTVMSRIWTLTFIY